MFYVNLRAPNKQCKSVGRDNTIILIKYRILCTSQQNTQFLSAFDSSYHSIIFRPLCWHENNVNRMTSTTTDLVEYKNYMNRYETDFYRAQFSLFYVLLRRGLKEESLPTHEDSAAYISF